MTTTTVNNASTVETLYDAFKKADIPFILEHVADDCKWIGTGQGTLPQGGTYIGKEAVRFFAKLGESVEFTSFNPLSVININDDEVVAFGNMSGISKITGKSSSSDWAMRWKFNEEGKVIYFQDFHDTAAAYTANQK